nr:hypothetical protein GCM10020093_105190 [Planobispora longispora]
MAHETAQGERGLPAGVHREPHLAPVLGHVHRGAAGQQRGQLLDDAERHALPPGDVRRGPAGAVQHEQRVVGEQAPQQFLGRGPLRVPAPQGFPDPVPGRRR